MQINRSATGRGGFTIVEVLLAMAILLMGSVAIIAFLTFGGATARHAQLRTQAALAVEAVVADIDRNIFPYEDGELGEPVDLMQRAVPGTRGVVYNAKAFANPELESEYRIDIEMTWESAGMKRSKTWSMLKIKELPFGERLRREFIEQSGGFKKSSSQAANGGGDK
ncbi:MAG: prepilin-type N-terminal cleavage/methylation domain-containing protein [Candidatus Paceibacteria bacterium]